LQQDRLSLPNCWSHCLNGQARLPQTRLSQPEPVGMDQPCVQAFTTGLDRSKFLPLNISTLTFLPGSQPG